MRLYLNERPRTLIIADTHYSLIVRHPYPNYSLQLSSHRSSHRRHEEKRSNNLEARRQASTKNRIILELVKTELINVSNFKDITPAKSKTGKQLLGFLGFINLKEYIFLGFITKSVNTASPKLDESIYMITDVEFYCLNNDIFDYTINQTDEDTNHSGHHEDYEHGIPTNPIKRLFNQGYFYYSNDFDITSNLQERGFSKAHNSRISAESVYFKKFLWNDYMISDLIEFRSRLSPIEKIEFDRAKFLTTITRGYAKSVNVSFRDNEDALLTLISKQSCQKKGPLFGDWGCDDEGAVSNFVESEIIIYSEQFCFSYVLIRGNVPSFWETLHNFSKKSIISKSGKKLCLTRSFEASQHAFRKHFDRLGAQFGDVHIIDCLLSDVDSYKGKLKENYCQHLKAFWQARGETDIDASEEIDAENHVNYRLSYTDLPVSTSFMKKIGYKHSNPGEMISPLVDTIVDYGALFFEPKKDSYIGKQLGVFRIDSFDCLSKANFISKVVSQEVFELAFRDMGIPVETQLKSQHAKLWNENDEVLTKLTTNYLSTSTDITSPKDLSSKHSFTAHLTKKYLNVVGEARPNELAMRELLGRLQDQKSVELFNPLHQFISQELKRRSKEFSFLKDIKIFASTFNVNGLVGSSQDIQEWVYPSKYDKNQDYDLVFVGFEEIVELTPGKMIHVKSDNLISWETKMKKILMEGNPKRSKYVALWSGQMGGIALLLFVKQSNIDLITNIESSARKTGLGGMSANKGGIALSLEYSRTKLCFVCSHLAAGLNNLDERHQNYKTIAKGISFSKNKKIRDHDGIIWLGDFNYRISLPNDTVRSMVKREEFQTLFESDQLNKQMASGESFPFYDEMEIMFPPTYKFDNNTNTYDTSDKQRIPAWTDRILSMSRSRILRQEVYDSNQNIVFSDHRPVYAFFKATANMINELTKKEVTHDIYENYTRVVGDVNFLITGNDVSKLVFDASDDVLPAPSSDVSKWWLNGGFSAKVILRDLSSDNAGESIINPKHPANPFARTSEPEFIKIDNNGKF